MPNTNLHKAKTAKNDEFYTQLTDVAKELMLDICVLSACEKRNTSKTRLCSAIVTIRHGVLFGSIFI